MRRAGCVDKTMYMYMYISLNIHTHKDMNFLFGSLLGGLDSTYLDCENLKLIYDSEVSPPFSVVGTLHQLILAEFQSNSL